MRYAIAGRMRMWFAGRRKFGEKLSELRFANSCMRTLISQTRKAMEAELYYVALMSALAIPDMAGAMGAQDRRATKALYVSWYDSWVKPRLFERRNRDNPFSGESCYIFRCSLLHQGSSQRPDSPYTNIMFIEPGHQNYSLHYCLIRGEALLIQIDQFVDEVLSGCELWLKSVEGTELFEKNYGFFARRHPNGLAPYVIGVPVIG